MKTKSSLIDNDGHLSDEGIALWVEAMAEDRVNRLPEEMVTHMEDCMECKEAAVELRGTIRDLQLPGDKAFDNLPEHIGSVVPRIRPFAVISRIAAAVIVLVAVGTIMALLVLTRPPDPGKLFSANFTPYTDLVTEKGPPATADSVTKMLIAGFDYYQHDRYENAAEVFQELYNNDPGSDTVAFFLANSILATDQSPMQAINILTRLISTPTEFSDQARWYLALAFLKKGNLEMAQNQLQHLVRSSESYKEKAEVLLNDIK